MSVKIWGILFLQRMLVFGWVVSIINTVGLNISQLPPKITSSSKPSTSILRKSISWLTYSLQIEAKVLTVTVYWETSKSFCLAISSAISLFNVD